MATQDKREEQGWRRMPRRYKDAANELISLAVRCPRVWFAPAEACVRQAGPCYWVALAGSVAARCVRIRAATRSYRAGLVQTS